MLESSGDFFGLQTQRTFLNFRDFHLSSRLVWFLHLAMGTNLKIRSFSRLGCSGKPGCNGENHETPRSIQQNQCICSIKGCGVITFPSFFMQSFKGSVDFKLIFLKPLKTITVNNFQVQLQKAHIGTQYRKPHKNK